MAPRPPYKSTSLSWDAFGTGADPAHSPILNPRDVVQVAFLLEEQEAMESEAADDDVRAPEGKIVLGQLHLNWRSAMGDRGSLSTGWLVARQR
jgi:trafficking protein particle complex subunit 13